MSTKSAIRRLLFILFLCMGMIHVKSVSAQLKYNFERINTENGLPANTIKGLQFDKINRFLWIATESGLVRYNGHTFQSFGDKGSTVKLNGRVVSINRKEDGAIFGRLLDETLFYIKDNLPLLGPQYLKVKYANDFLNYKYSLTSQNHTEQKVSITENEFKIGANHFITLERDNDLIFCKYQSGQFDSLFVFKKHEQGFVLNDRLFLIDNKGEVKEFLFKHDKSIGLKEVLSVNKNHLNNSELKIFQNGIDEAFVLNANKLFKVSIEQDKLIFSLVTDQLPNNEFIRYLQVDELTKTIFLGTDNRGLLIGRPIYFNRIMPRDYKGGTSSAAYAQVVLKNGNIQTNSGQIFGNENGKTPLVFYRPSSTNTYIDNKNHLFGSNADGVFEYDLVHDKLISTTKEIDYERNSFIQFKDDIYSINEKGVAKKGGNGFWQMVLNFKTVPTGFSVYQMSVVGDKDILVTTTDGLYIYNIVNNTFKRIFKDKNGANFRSIFNLKGYYLIGTYGSGIYMYKDGIIKQMPLDPNKYLSFTHCFMLDDHERIWASTNKGLFMSPAKSLIDFWESGPGNITYKYYGKLEGIDVLEMNGGCNPCAIQLKNGLISIPGIDGLIQFDPNALPSTQFIPKAFLDKVYINGSYYGSDIINKNLPFNAKKIEFQLGISGMLSQEDFLLEYKFDNDPWNRIGVENTNIVIGNPGYGAHKLLVRIRNSINKKWELNSYDFSIDFPWYFNPFMLFLYLIILMSLIYLYVKLRVIIYRRRQIELENEVLIKTKSIRDMNSNLTKRNQAKDQVIAIMNHDILTPLKYLHITADNLVNQVADTGAKKSILQIASTTKELEYQTLNMLNWVKFDSLEKLPNVQKVDIFHLINQLFDFIDPFKQNPNIELVNKISEDTFINSWPEQLRVLLYNIVMNSVRATQIGKISIDIEINKNDYFIIIEDTGKGINASMIKYLITGANKEEVEQLPRFKTGNGVGYQIIRSLVQLMDAILEIDSVEGKGTRVKIIFKQS